MTNIVNYSGAHQTTYADWGRELMNNYPYLLHFKKNERIIEVYYQSFYIASFDFDRCVGHIELDGPKSEEKVKEFEQFEEFNLGDFIVE